MNAMILFAIVLCVFVMGYRFYARFLALGVFLPPRDVGMPALQHPDHHDHGTPGRWQLAGFHAAASAGLLSVTGAGIGVAWGWVPAFLWIVVGTLVAGGTYVLASLWSSLRENGNSLAGVIFGSAGAWAALPVFLLGVGVLVLVCTLTLVLLGQLLQTHPEATWFFLAILVSTEAVRRTIASTAVVERCMWGLVPGSLLLAGLYLGQAIPLNVSGALSLHVNGNELIRIPGEIIWIGVALAAAFRAVNAPQTAVSTPRGVLVGVLIMVLMLLIASGLVLSAPDLVAPEFNTAEGLPGVYPLLFLAITAGATSGVSALIVTGPTMRQTSRHADAPVVAFTGAMVNGALAFLVLAALCAGFTESAEWASVYGSLPVDADVFTWLDLAITKSARFVAALGFAMPLAVAMVAAILASMALAMLEATLRALSFGIEEFAEDFALDRIKGRTQRVRVAAGSVAVAAFFVLQSGLGLNQWLFLGLTNQLFAGAVMMLLGLILFKYARGTAFVLVPASFVIVCGFWGWFWLLSEWWNTENRLLFALALVAGVLAAVSVIACTRAFAREKHEGTAVASPDTR